MRARVVRERTEGKTAYAIARDLNSDAVPTAQGARLVASYGPRAADAGRRSAGPGIPLTRSEIAMSKITP